MKYIILLFTVILVLSCNRKKDNSATNSPVLKLVYSLRVVNNKVVSFNHFLVINGYNDLQFDKYNFVNLVKSYKDTCTINKDTISAIYLMKSDSDCGFERNELSYDHINENSIIAFYFTTNNISGIKIFNGANDKFFQLNNGSLEEYK